ncbi:MAG: Secreted/periplasmic Zn-dependent peptidase insulinase-like [Parachlamydiales bacterium]|nr:Secreted/periplasmic Zn-dependent peptidase insulinase-like [Parachlamydiales bacterium]
MKFLILFAVIAAQPIWPDTPALQEIIDEANLPLLNPDLSTRKTAKIRLVNGLEAYLISDPQADQSAAAMAVQTGSWDDPIEYPGMAHFCEHMLFKGSQKFPNENEFSTLIADNNGLTNAFTASDRTVYMFSSCEEGFLPILERFARFFIDPLFNLSGIKRELHAVDQEFAKNIENDNWREYMVFKETGNPHHPNAHFSIGNSETLANIPQSALKKWHYQHYIAPKMRLIVYSHLPIESLKETVRNYFSLVPNHDTLAANTSAALTSDQQKGHFIYIQPIKHSKMLTLSWELSSDISLDPAKSAQLFCYAMGRGQPYSLHEQLIKEGFINDLSMRVDELGDPSHRFLQIELDLTKEGLQQIDSVINRVFQTISHLKNSGIPRYLFDEMNNIAKLAYQFQPRKDAFRYIAGIGEEILDEPLASYPRQTMLAADYDPQKIAKAASYLTPENALYFLRADFSDTDISLNLRERWIGAEYAIGEIPAHWLKTWKKAEAHPNIRLANPNPFLPTNFDLVSAINDPKTSTPLLISEDDFGLAYYSRVSEFRTPESVYFLHILTPQINATARSHALASLYLNYLTDRLHPTLSAARTAGLKSSFGIDRNRLHCTVSGFSDKASLLLQEILKQLATPPPTPAQFEQYIAYLSKELENASKDLAFIQAKELAASLIYGDKPTQSQQYDALQNISYDDFCTFLHSMYDETYVQAMFCGNLSLKDAESAWLDVRHLLGSAPFRKENHPPTKILSLPEDKGPFAIHEKSDVLGHAAFLVLDVGTFSFEKRAAQEILAAVLKESFFDTLRSKQKTGYIAQSDHQELELRLFQYFFVQSNSHQPDDLLSRFELFLETFVQDLPETIPAARFAALKQNISESLFSRFRSLNEKSALWNQLAFDYEADFSWLEKRLEGFAQLNYETFLKDAQSFLSKDNRKRLAVLFEGRIDHPFIYESVTADEIGRMAEYFTRTDVAAQMEDAKQD